MSFKRELAKALNKKRNNVMWKKLAWVLVTKVVLSVDWNAVLDRILKRMSALVDDKLGVTVDLSKLEAKDVLAIVEEVLDDCLDIHADLNKDGVIGDGKED